MTNDEIVEELLRAIGGVMISPDHLHVYTVSTESDSDFRRQLLVKALEVAKDQQLRLYFHRPELEISGANG